MFWYAGDVLYDVIERQRLETEILEGIEAVVARCPDELRGYLSIPIARAAKSAGRPLIVTVVSTHRGWFVSAGGFYPQYDTRWLSKLEMGPLRSCARFLRSGKDIGEGLSVDAAVRRASELKHHCEIMSRRSTLSSPGTSSP